MILPVHNPAGSETVPPTAIATAARVRATMTVTATDMAKRLVSFQGPGANVYQVKTGPKVHLDKLKIGDRLLATYVEAVAVKLEKPTK